MGFHSIFDLGRPGGPVGEPTVRRAVDVECRAFDAGGGGRDTFAELPVNPCKSDSRITFGSTVAPVWMMALNPGVSGSVSMVHSQDRCVHSTE